MRFQQTKNRVLNLFDENEVRRWIDEKKYHQKRDLVETLSNGTKIFISHIGYKSTLRKGRVIYDYRVDIEKGSIRTSLSHNNIILDIYNKVLNGKLNHKLFLKHLVLSSKESDFDIEGLQKECSYIPTNPPNKLLDYFENIHKNLNKPFNRVGNESDLTFEELFYSILYISIQEDINYPIKNNFEGRRMCYSRYIETLYIFENRNRKIEEVIERSLVHKRTTFWEELNYSFLKNIKLFLW